MKRRIITLAIAISAFTVCATAQEQSQERMGQKQRVEHMVRDLGLDSVQAVRFMDVMKERRPYRRGHGVRPSREEMEAAMKKADEKIRTILTEEQYSRYQELRSQRLQRRRR